MMLSFFAFLIVIMLAIIIYQVRSQRLATDVLIQENQLRTRLYQDADESTTLILSRTIQNIAQGSYDPNLESDAFTVNVIRELVKRRVSKDKWLEIQTNERLVHELFLLLRDRS